MTIYLARKESQVPSRLAPLMPRWAAGVAFPFRKVLVIRLDRLTFVPGGSLQVVLRHELVHLVMGALGPLAFRKLPWWFHEGTAQVLSGLPFFSQKEDLGALVQLNLLPYLKDLGADEDSTQRATDLAYQEAFSFASFLEDRLGDDVFAQIVKAQEKAPDFNLAFLDATGFSYITLETQWRELLLSRPWATIQELAGDFFLLLLALSLPLVGLALMRRFKREEEIEQAWKEEEESSRNFPEERDWQEGEEDPGEEEW